MEDDRAEEGPNFGDETWTFGDRITQARLNAGLEQAQLARRLGINLRTLQNWENDRSEPRSNKLHMLAGMLNVSMIWLLSGQGDAPEEHAEDDLRSSTLERCLAELQQLRAEHAQITKGMARVERRLRTLIAA